MTLATINRPALIRDNSQQQLLVWQKHICDNIDAINRSGPPFLFCRKSANQALTNPGQEYAVTWDTYVDGTGLALNDGSLVMGANTGELTVTVDGLYHVSAVVSFASNAVGNRYAYIEKNSSVASGELAAINNQAAVNGDVTFISVAGVFYLTTADSLVVLANQTSGGALDIKGGSTYDCTLRAYLCR